MLVAFHLFVHDHHGAPLRDPARVSGVGALALGALRPADTRAAAAQGRGARAAGSDAHGVGRDAAGGDSGRSRPLAVPGRGPSEGPRAAADLGRDPGRADAGAAGDAGAQAALPAPRPPGHRAGACRDDRHAGAERDVGHRRRAGLHVGRRVGLDLHSGRALERGVCGMARVQGWEPVCGARADRPGALAHLWRPRRRQRSRAGAADGPRQPVPVRPLSQPDPVLGHAAQLRLCRGTGNERRGGAVESHAQEASDPRAHLPEPQGDTRRSDRVRGAVQHDLAAREARVSHAERGPRGARATPAGRRSVS